MTQVDTKVGKSKIVSGGASWNVYDDDSNIFSDCITIDPNEAHMAWAKLAVDTWAYEFRSMPALMHVALIKTLRKRGRAG